MIQSSCHCGSITIDIPRRPRTLTSCNCSICRRTGALWAYYRATSIRLHAPRGSTMSYAWGKRGIRFVRCRHCGCLTHWEGARNPRTGYVGINMRNADPQITQSVRVRRLDGASTWKFLD